MSTSLAQSMENGKQPGIDATHHGKVLMDVQAFDEVIKLLKGRSAWMFTNLRLLKSGEHSIFPADAEIVRRCYGMEQEQATQIEKSGRYVQILVNFFAQDVPETEWVLLNLDEREKALWFPE